ISLNTGSYTSISTGVNAGLSGATLVDTNSDTYADIAFAGDEDGNLWKFYLGSSPPSPNPKRLYQPPLAIGTSQPITTRPEVGEHPYGGYMVLFGTGSLTSIVDAVDPSYPTQALYGIWDSGPGEVIVTQTLAEVTDATFTYDATTTTESIRYVVTNNTIDYNCVADDATCDIGWKINLPNMGERVIGPPQLRNSRMIVVTTNPRGTSGGSDLVGDSWMMSVNYLSGGDNNVIVLNLNGDADLNTEDVVDIGAVDDPDLRAPVGLHLGDGNISQPTLASITSGIDAIFINGLRMPLPIIPQVDGPLLAGHLDVETDSPSGGNIAPNSISKHSEGYNIDTNDGLGLGVDGHFHDYDTANNITYVDIFQLEPRRGKASYDPVSAPCSITENEKTIDITGEGDCLQVLEGELNRAYDTLATDRDGNTDVVASEVYARGTALPMDKDQEFIVVLANADLSPAAELQIGCRTWNAQEYQDMIREQLEDLDRTPSELRDTKPEHGNATLIFSAADIASGASDPGGVTCPVDSPDPTLRIYFANSDILQGGIHGTRSQCVLGLHDYRDPIDYWDNEVLCYAPKYNSGETVDCSGFTNRDGDPLRDPGSTYIKDPVDSLHITELPSTEGTGYRWRNGALTVQLLEVNGDGSAAYTLQDPGLLPSANPGGRFGGTLAQGFEEIGNGANARPAPLEGANDNESGLLHETTLYWHLGDLSEGVQRGDPSSVPCYGDPSWSSVWSQETRGLTQGQYQALYEAIEDDTLAAYDAAVLALRAALATGDEAAANQALLELGELIAADEELARYHRYRDYGPGAIPEQHLREIDRNLTDDPNDPDDDPSVDDGTPGQVDDLTTGPGTSLNREILGPNFAIGRRTWIDLRQ
ncbi:MAG: PilC/PilY family type IV pilus protein, partial [Gammaproteobacteria bacterium]